jgi:hypothetical protein
MSRGSKTLIFLILLTIIFFPFLKISQKKTSPKINIIEGEIKEGDILGNIFREKGSFRL